MPETPSTIVSTEWLADHLDAPDICIVDASWYLPAQERDPLAEFNAQHIPGAVFFDIDEICDTESDLPHMLPSPEKFSARVRKLGLGDGNRIIVYDGAGLFSAARVWWMFKVMGHSDVAVLNGGLPKWVAEERPIEDLPPTAKQERHFTARLNSLLVRDIDDIKSNIETKDAQVVDARPAARFRGEVPEPRAGMRSGHIPGSCSVPITDIQNEDGTLKSDEELHTLFESAGIDLNKPVITSCGSGVTAAGLYLALTHLGCRDLALYDGSWSEWGSREDTPIDTSHANDS